MVRWLSFISLLAFSLLWLARWPTFPLFLDASYHLLIAQQIVEAGGPITHEWWEHAPVGRPHLYPPVLHLLLAGLLKIGCPPVVALKVLTALLLPALLVSIYLAMRRLFHPTVALASLWMAMAPFPWMLQLSGTLAATLALIELLWLLVAIEQEKVLAAGGLLALLFYTHLGLPWVGLASLAVYGLLRRSRRRALLKTSWGLGLAIPWLVHLALYAPWLHPVWRRENTLVEITPAIVLLAGVGIVQAFRKAGQARLLLALVAGCTLMIPRFTFRWLSGEGLLPAILLAGYGLEGISRWVTRRWRPHAAPWLGIVVLSGLVMALPTVEVDVERSRRRWFWPDAAPFHLLNWPSVQPHGRDVQLYNRHTERLAQTVASLSQPGEILWANFPYGGGVIAVLAHRALSAAMLSEVRPQHAVDPYASAHLLVWFQIAPLPGTPRLEGLISRYRLELVGEDALALVFRNPHATQLARPPNAVIPLWLAFVLLCSVFGLIIWDFRWDFRRHFAKRHC